MTIGQRDPGGRRSTIGVVLRALQQEFPDVSASKVRFLETEGLIDPERTAAGYRLYSDADIERLRWILTAQRDRYWPLKVIREALDALDRGLSDPGDGQPQIPQLPIDPELPEPADLLDLQTISLTGPELREASGIDARLLSDLQDYGLVRADGRGLFPGEAVAIARAAAHLAAYGLEPRHLRPFRSAADREIGLVQQAAGAGRDTAVREERTAEVLSACIALHVGLVRAGLARR